LHSCNVRTQICVTRPQCVNAILKPNPYEQDPLCVQYLLNFMYLNVSS